MRCGLDLASMIDCFGWHAFRGLHDYEKVRFGILVVSFFFCLFCVSAGVRGERDTMAWGAVQ